MGVIGSYCQLCRLPLQHDHYVPMVGADMLRIYRGSSADRTEWDGENCVRFGAEHRWLEDAIAIPRRRGDKLPAVAAGRVEDGVLIDGASGEHLFIWEGIDDGVAFHRYCWELAGSFDTVEAAAVNLGHFTFGWAAVETFRGQLFEMRELIDHGKAWMLVDPRGDTVSARRSRARIAAILEQVRRSELPRRSTRRSTVVEILAADRGWCGEMLRSDDHAPRCARHYRADVHPELADLGAYPNLIWAMKEYAGDGLPTAECCDELDAFELAIKSTVEAGGAAILLMTMVGGGQGQYLIYARDEDKTRAAIDALPFALHSKRVEYDNEADPTWNVYFSQVDPRRG